jgi:hypothetical protein
MGSTKSGLNRGWNGSRELSIGGKGWRDFSSWPPGCDPVARGAKARSSCSTLWIPNNSAMIGVF